MFTSPKITLVKNKIWYNKQVNNLGELAKILGVEKLTPENENVVVQTDNTGQFLKIKNGELFVTFKEGQNGLSFGGK